LKYRGPRGGATEFNYRKINRKAFKNKNFSLLFSMFNRIKFNALIYYLEKYFKCPVQLEITRLYNPAHDSNILAHIIGLSGKKYRFWKIMKYIYRKTKIYKSSLKFMKFNFYPSQIYKLPSYLSGVKVRLAGRFHKHRIIPRKTVTISQKGSLSRSVVDYAESSRFVNKSKRGSFSLTVSISHIY